MTGGGAMQGAAMRNHRLRAAVRGGLEVLYTEPKKGFLSDEGYPTLDFCAFDARRVLGSVSVESFDFSELKE